MMSTKPTRLKRRIAFVIPILALFLICSIFFGAFGFSSICTRCGAIRDTTDWQIPLTSVTLFRTSSERQTPVSAELLRSNVVVKHDHQWLFISGAGNGVTCAIGEGRHIRPVVQSDGVASILDASERFGEVQFRERLVRLMFDPKTSEVVRGLGFSAPTNGFTDAAEFRSWLGRNRDFFEDMVQMYQKR